MVDGPLDLLALLLALVGIMGVLAVDLIADRDSDDQGPDDQG